MTKDNGWISVDERLPAVEDGGAWSRVLWWANGRPHKVLRWNYCRLNPHIYSHWQPLPPPPGETEEG